MDKKLSEIFKDVKMVLQMAFVPKPMEDILEERLKGGEKSNGPQKPKNPGPWCF